ncbi:hypothetical protein ThvES_00020650 [Thiovulum sp. ES]|nr:hypothetical protein ThvES_00020650 [Thiovulum sp. ES]
MGNEVYLELKDQKLPYLEMNVLEDDTGKNGKGNLPEGTGNNGKDSILYTFGKGGEGLAFG